MNASRISLAILVAATLSGCIEPEAEEAPPARPVLTVVAAPFTAHADGYAGTVEAKFSADLGFRVLGRITARDVDVGDLVTRGMELATLDPTALALAVRSAEADLAEAEAQRDYAVLAENRQQVLLERKTSTAESFESARQAREAADAAVDQMRAGLDKAREQLGYARLFSDTDGVVTAVSAEVGQVVSAGQTVVTIARLDVREAVVDVPEADRASLVAGAAFEVLLQSDPTIRVRGAIREVAPQADAVTRTRRVKITLEAPPAAFRLGSTVTAVPTRPVVGAIRLPASALLTDGGRDWVWVVDPAGKTVSRRPVTVAKRDERFIEIADGLAEGTRVVTAGVHSLTEGQTVRLADEAAE